MSERKTYRIGIDVGGTFTKAVLIDNETFEVVGRYSVMTTHSDLRGVAKGVIEVFRNVLERSRVDPVDVVFLAHSTTQATNALLAATGKKGTYNIATGVETDVLTIWNELREAAGSELEPELADLRPGELQHSCLDIARAKRELGWTPKVPITDGLRKTYAALIEEFDRV